MKTDDLIRAISADTISVRPVGRVLPAVLLASALGTALLFYATMGVRPDLGAALGRAPVFLKHAFPVLMAFAALGAVARLARPEAKLDGWILALALAPAIVAVAFWATAAATPLAEWPAAIAGHSIGVCLVCIPVLGAPILAGALWALRRGASARPVLSGALAGLLSGSAAAAVYAAYCTDDSPMFWGVWYTLAIGVVVAAGALLGRRLLRW